MHETIIANQIIKEAKKHGKVKELTIEVGDLAHLPLEEMKQTLSTMVDWKLIFIPKKATVECSCGYKGEPKILEKGHDSTIFICPKCNSIPNPIDGTEIILKEVKCV